MNSAPRTSNSGEVLQDHLHIYEREQRKKLSDCLQLENHVYVSSFEGLNLSEYVKVKSFLCNTRHTQHDKKCSCEGLIKVANFIERNGYMKLKEAFMLSSPGATYTSLHARQKLLQMPLTAIGIGSQAEGNFFFVIVPKQQSINYDVFRSLLEKTLQSRKVEMLSKEKVREILFLAESEAERKRLRCTIVKASSLSSRQALRMYGFHDMEKK